MFILALVISFRVEVAGGVKNEVEHVWARLGVAAALLDNLDLILDLLHLGDHELEVFVEIVMVLKEVVQNLSLLLTDHLQDTEFGSIGRHHPPRCFSFPSPPS